MARAAFEGAAGQARGLTRLSVDVQGVHCAACVWVIGELFDRRDNARECLVNPARGRIQLTVGPGFDLEGWARDVEAIGYALGPAADRASTGDGLTLRMGVSLALSANVMMLSLAIYFGLADGAFHTLARQLIFALSATTVVVGGSWFVRAAWQSLRRGALHLDLPIALGILLAFGGSTWSFFRGDPRGEFFDTLAVFVSLMLVGRWLQDRAVASNRRRLLSSTGAEGLFTRRLSDGRAELVRCDSVRAGDTLLLARGDLVPVDATLEADAALRLDWINGESEPLGFRQGQRAPAGAFLVSESAVRAVADTAFVDSPLNDLLAAPAGEAGAGAFWDRIGRWYVVGVLALATGAFLLWASDPSEALRVTTAVLVVTCPCAFGIAVPLGYELVHTASARRGLFVRTATALDRARDVRRVIFDKTGTLTEGVPALVDRAPVEALDPDDRAMLYDLAARSTHPKARAVASAIDDGVLRPEVTAHEELGQGMQALVDGVLWRLGRPAWAAPEHPAGGADLVFARAGQPLATLHTHEALRPDAEREVRALEALGYEAWILSGDATDKVHALADRLGIPRERALGERSATDKAAWLKEHGADRDALFVGDGINDTFAAEVALLSGTPSIDRPFMPARCDFYFVTAGLGPIRRMLLDARRLRSVVRADLALAVAYNLGAVGLAYAGLVEPWLAAILMPVSSVTTIALTAIWLRENKTWTS
ncbi:MAG: HAD-IC family P-type ATPase [Sandaracinaceae bacterium]